MSDAVRVILHNHCTATVEIKKAALPDMEQAIEQRLRSPEPLPWRNDPEGVKVDLVLETGTKKPRWKFFLGNDAVAKSENS
jgi:hypothetical protein